MDNEIIKKKAEDFAKKIIEANEEEKYRITKIGESNKYYMLVLDSEKISDGIEKPEIVVNKETGELFAGSCLTIVDNFKDLNYGDFTFKNY